MKSPHFFIVKPKGDTLYNNVKKTKSGEELIISSTFENHETTNREAEVVSVPTRYKGPILPGDNIIVHHNTFRKYYSMQGEERFSANRIKDNIYRVDPDMVFAFKSSGEYWTPVDGYCFVKPIDNTDEMNTRSEEQLHGELVYIGKDLMDDGLQRGDRIIFKPVSEYEFNIDGQKLYRVKTKSVCLILN